jgi:hypothetical protein
MVANDPNVDKDASGSYHLVKMTANELRTLGQNFIQWGEDIDKASFKLDLANITPGSTAEAVALKGRYKERLDIWKANFGTLRLTFNDVGNALVQMSFDCQNVEDFNALEADKIRGVVDAAASHYDGAAKILTPTPGDVLYPKSAPKEAPKNKP